MIEERESKKVQNMQKAKRALISLTDKTGCAAFAGALTALGIELLSTGGTAKVLREAGLKVVEVSDFTGFPEMLDGRVKTLHPKVHGGILHQRANPAHVSQCREHDIAPIDLVVVNLYAFAEAVARPDCTLPEAIEQIDIGGPTLLRAAAKNFQDVTVIVDPTDYPLVLQELGEKGHTSLQTRFILARKVFALTSAYDAAIRQWLQDIDASAHPFLQEPQDA